MRIKLKHAIYIHLFNPLPPNVVFVFVPYSYLLHTFYNIFSNYTFFIQNYLTNKMSQITI